MVGHVDYNLEFVNSHCRTSSQELSSTCIIEGLQKDLRKFGYMFQIWGRERKARKVKMYNDFAYNSQNHGHNFIDTND